jgi:amidohydrolase
MTTSLLTEADALFTYTQSMRRDFHRHPELGFQEFRTAGIVSSELSKLGLEVATGVGKTGVVALLEGTNPGPTILLRVDMDALPIHEVTGAEYASQNAGVMHACGHDGHTAIGLSVAKLLVEHRHEIAGTIKLVFQPAEEGLGGAQAMLLAGVLTNPHPDFCISLHLWNEEPLGWISATPGPVMAASETFKIKINGKGGHGASPHLTVDPVIAAAQIISALQSIVARNVAPLESAVISVTVVKAGEAHNVIPNEAELQGTIRSFKPDVRELVLNRFNQVVQGVAEALCCSVDCEIHSITPAVVNDAQITHQVQDLIKEILPDHELNTSSQTMGSEDMAFFQQEIPGCYIFLGSHNAEKGLVAPHHHPKFDFDEMALPSAIALMAGAALRLTQTGE